MNITSEVHQTAELGGLLKIRYRSSLGHLTCHVIEIINIKGHGPLFKAFSYEIGKDLTFNINNILDAEFLNLENTPALAIGNLSKRWKNIFQKN